MEGYVIIKTLGSGSYGHAYLVEKKNEKSKCVLKEIKVSHLNQKDLDSAQKEVRVLSSLLHNHITKFYESFENNGCLYIAMEYCGGGDLQKLIDSRNGINFPEDRILDWFVQLCLAVKFIHQRYIIHRDIKTQNVFLTDEGRVKLGDFGIAKILDRTSDLANTCIGTPYYLSPEMCDNKPYSNKSDIWAVGCVLYEMAALKHAYDADNMKVLVIKIINCAYNPLPPRYSRDFRMLIKQIFQRNPRSRPSISSVLSMKFIAKRVPRFLSDADSSEELQLHCQKSKTPKSKVALLQRNALRSRIGISSPASKYGAASNISKKARANISCSDNSSSLAVARKPKVNISCPSIIKHKISPNHYKPKADVSKPKIYVSYPNITRPKSENQVQTPEIQLHKSVAKRTTFTKFKETVTFKKINGSPSHNIIKVSSPGTKNKVKVQGITRSFSHPCNNNLLLSPKNRSFSSHDYPDHGSINKALSERPSDPKNNMNKQSKLNLIMNESSDSFRKINVSDSILSRLDKLENSLDVIDLPRASGWLVDLYLSKKLGTLKNDLKRLNSTPLSSCEPKNYINEILSSIRKQKYSGSSDLENLSKNKMHCHVNYLVQDEIDKFCHSAQTRRKVAYDEERNCLESLALSRNEFVPHCTSDASEKKRDDINDTETRNINNYLSSKNSISNQNSIYSNPDRKVMAHSNSGNEDCKNNIDQQSILRPYGLQEFLIEENKFDAECFNIFSHRNRKQWTECPSDIITHLSSAQLLDGRMSMEFSGNHVLTTSSIYIPNVSNPSVPKETGKKYSCHPPPPPHDVIASSSADEYTEKGEAECSKEFGKTFKILGSDATEEAHFSSSQDESHHLENSLSHKIEKPVEADKTNKQHVFSHTTCSTNSSYNAENLEHNVTYEESVISESDNTEDGTLTHSTLISKIPKKRFFSYFSCQSPVQISENASIASQKEMLSTSKSKARFSAILKKFLQWERQGKSPSSKLKMSEHKKQLTASNDVKKDQVAEPETKENLLSSVFSDEDENRILESHLEIVDHKDVMKDSDVGCLQAVATLETCSSFMQGVCKADVSCSGSEHTTDYCDVNYTSDLEVRASSNASVSSSTFVNISSIANSTLPTLSDNSCLSFGICFDKTFKILKTEEKLLKDSSYFKPLLLKQENDLVVHSAISSIGATEESDMRTHIKEFAVHVVANVLEGAFRKLEENQINICSSLNNNVYSNIAVSVTDDEAAAMTVNNAGHLMTEEARYPVEEESISVARDETDSAAEINIENDEAVTTSSLVQVTDDLALPVIEDIRVALALGNNTSVTEDKNLSVTEAEVASERGDGSVFVTDGTSSVIGNAASVTKDWMNYSTLGSDYLNESIANSKCKANKSPLSAWTFEEESQNAQNISLSPSGNSGSIIISSDSDDFPNDDKIQNDRYQIDDEHSHSHATVSVEPLFIRREWAESSSIKSSLSEDVKCFRQPLEKLVFSDEDEVFERDSVGNYLNKGLLEPVTPDGDVHGWIEEQRARMEEVLGLKLFLDAYRCLECAFEQNHSNMKEALNQVKTLIGSSHEHLASDILQLIVTESIHLR